MCKFFYLGIEPITFAVQLSYRNTIFHAFSSKRKQIINTILTSPHKQQVLFTHSRWSVMSGVLEWCIVGLWGWLVSVPGKAFGSASSSTTDRLISQPAKVGEMLQTVHKPMPQVDLLAQNKLTFCASYRRKCDFALMQPTV